MASSTKLDAPPTFSTTVFASTIVTMLFLMVLAFFLGVLVGVCRIKAKVAGTPATNAQSEEACTGAQSEAASPVITEPIIDVELERDHEYEVIGFPETRDINNFQNTAAYGTADTACSTTLTSNLAYGTNIKALNKALTSNVSYGANTLSAIPANGTNTTVLNTLTSTDMEVIKTWSNNATNSCQLCVFSPFPTTCFHNSKINKGNTQLFGEQSFLTKLKVNVKTKKTTTTFKAMPAEFSLGKEYLTSVCK